MKVIHARNVNNAMAKAIPYLLIEGELEQSRNGNVLVSPTPVMTVYTNPTERVLFSASRDANPFFHLMESLWMLAGRNDLEFPMFFNRRFKDYSDDGLTVHGAYGHRWRHWFAFDQIEAIVEELQENPNSRRAVLQMWSPVGDTCDVTCMNDKQEVVGTIGGLKSKDVPCNTNAYFDIRHGVLNMTVLCRSNDIIWGAYGANAVHFSILQEYMAAMLKVPVGEYRQFSNNFHMYTELYGYSNQKLDDIAKESAGHNYYATTELPLQETVVMPFKLVTVDDIKAWNADLNCFMAQPSNDVLYNDPFFNAVAVPMYRAWFERKHKMGDGLAHIMAIQADDWRMACTQWVSRRERKH